MRHAAAWPVALPRVQRPALLLNGLTPFATVHVRGSNFSALFRFELCAGNHHKISSIYGRRHLSLRSRRLRSRLVPRAHLLRTTASTACTLRARFPPPSRSILPPSRCLLSLSPSLAVLSRERALGLPRHCEYTMHACCPRRATSPPRPLPRTMPSSLPPPTSQKPFEHTVRFRSSFTSCY